MSESVNNFEIGEMYAVANAGKIAFVQYLGTYPISDDIFKVRKANLVGGNFVLSDKEMAVTRIYANTFRKWEEVKHLGLPYKNWREL